MGEDGIGGRASLGADDGERENFHRSARTPPTTRGHAGHITPNHDTAGHTLTSRLCRVPGPSPTGIATLYIDQDPAAELAIKVQPGHFSLAGEGINAGRDAGQPVSSQYTPPFEFTGGTLHQVVLERGDETFTDLERHTVASYGASGVLQG